MPRDRSAALDHVVLVLFEHRSSDNVLGRLYGPVDGKQFDGVVGKDLSNPIPAWAEHGTERGVVRYSVATDMDSPNPDSGEEWYHTNTQLFNTLDEHNRFKIGEGVTAPYNVPPAATLTTCRPRHTPSIGRSRSSANRASSSSKVSRTPSGSAVCGCRVSW